MVEEAFELVPDTWGCYREQSGRASLKLPDGLAGGFSRPEHFQQSLVVVFDGQYLAHRSDRQLREDIVPPNADTVFD